MDEQLITYNALLNWGFELLRLWNRGIEISEGPLYGLKHALYVHLCRTKALLLHLGMLCMTEESGEGLSVLSQVLQRS